MGQRKQSIEMIFEEDPVLDLLHKDVKPVIINMFRELKEVMSKETKENMRRIYQQIEYE